MNIAIIGSGISGLYCAYKLKQFGHHIDIYEKNKEIGVSDSSADSIFRGLLEFHAQLRVFHWQTRSFSEHSGAGATYDSVDDILDKLNEDSLSDLSDDIFESENNNDITIEMRNMEDKILETYNDIKKCCIEIFMGYLILIDSNNPLLDKHHEINRCIESELNKKSIEERVKLQQIQMMRLGYESKS